MNKKTTVLIVDDHPLFRQGLRSIISSNPKFEVVGEANSGEEGLQMAKALKPDIVLMDNSLPDTSGIQVTHEIRNLLPNTRIMIVSMHAKIDFITEALQAGATGYLSKKSAVERLSEGLNVVSKGEYFLDSVISQQVVKRLLEPSPKMPKPPRAAFKTLTTREQEVLRLIAKELSVNEIAETLHVSIKTVDNYRASIMKKLKIHNSLELARYIVKHGLVDEDFWKI